MKLREIFSIVIGGLFLALLLCDVLVWPVGRLLLWTQKRLGFPRSVKTGPERLIGQTAAVFQPFAFNERKRRKLGKVRLNGETWWACLLDEQVCQVQQGEEVQVERVDGLMLVVHPMKKE